MLYVLFSRITNSVVMLCIARSYSGSFKNCSFMMNRQFTLHPSFPPSRNYLLNCYYELFLSNYKFSLIEVLLISTSGLASFSAACDGPLGLQSGQIADHQISSSVANSHPEDGRLNHNSSAWCFLYSEVQRSGEDVYLEVDLGRPRLLSGLQTQGPPASLYGAAYMRYISLGVHISTDGLAWEDCCSEDSDTRTNFYADDKNDEIGAVKTHAFSDLVVARFVRVRVSTGLRWIGHDNKCFRFELLGCSEESRGETELSATSQPAGYIQGEIYMARMRERSNIS